MQKKKKGGNVLLSLIFLCGALLCTSLLSLGERVINAEAKAVSDPYPGLYVSPATGIVEPEGKTVYLTFDDGPSPNTERLLDLLKEENVKATFFVTAQYEDSEYAKSMLRRMRDEGHSIGLHTYTHDFGTIYSSVECFLEDLAKIDAFIFEATGLHVRVLRFPGGSTTRNCDKALMREIADEVTRRGYVFYDWTVPSGDDGATAAPVSDLVRNIQSGVNERSCEILLFHDNATPTTTPDAVAELIPLLRDEGYSFDRITQKTPPVQFIYQ